VVAFLGEAKGNATLAAKMAGYSGDADTLKVQGSRLLTNAYVRARIDGRLDAEGATVEAVVRELSEVAFSTATGRGGLGSLRASTPSGPPVTANRR
jgi:phage terminase small subunit